MKTVLMLAVLIAFSSVGFGQTEICVAPLVIGSKPENPRPVGTQLAYAVDDDGTKLVKEVSDTYASGSGFWFRFADGREVLFRVP